MQDGIAGELPLRVEGEGQNRTIAVRTPPSTLLETAKADDPRLRDALAGLPLGELPPALMEGGCRWWLVELADEASLRSATPNWPGISALAEATVRGVCVFARSDDPTYYLAVRWVGRPRNSRMRLPVANATLPRG